MGISDALPQRTTSCTMLLLDIPVPFEQPVYFTLVRDLLQANFSNSCAKCDAVAADSICAFFSPRVLRGQTPLPGVSIVFSRQFGRLVVNQITRKHPVWYQTVVSYEKHN